MLFRSGVTNDKNSYEVTVEVVDNGNGTLTATPSTGKTPVKFTNNYSVEPTTASFPVEKELVVPEGLTGPAEWEFTITATAKDGAPEAKTMEAKVNQNTKTVTFGDIEYTKPGKYTYELSESGSVKGVKNDEKK